MPLNTGRSKPEFARDLKRKCFEEWLRERTGVSEIELDDYKLLWEAWLDGYETGHQEGCEEGFQDGMDAAGEEQEMAI